MMKKKMGILVLRPIPRVEELILIKKGKYTRTEKVFIIFPSRGLQSGGTTFKYYQN